MKNRTSTGPALGLTLAVCLSASTLPALADTGEGIEKDVRVRVIKCEGADCTEMTESMAKEQNLEVFVGDDMGKTVVIRTARCEGDDCKEHESVHNMSFVGEHGDVEVWSSDGGYAWVGRHGHHGDAGAGGAYLGVGLTELTPELRGHFGVPAGAGVMISKVMADSPAAKAGLEAGDIIERVDGESVANGSALAKAIRGHEAGASVVLDFWRDGAASSTTAVVEERDVGGHHGMHFGDSGRRIRKVVVECDSDEENCASNLEVAGLDEFDCGGSEECEVKVKCNDGGCICSINGEDADCAGIPGVPGR